MLQIAVPDHRVSLQSEGAPVTLLNYAEELNRLSSLDLLKPIWEPLTFLAATKNQLTGLATESS